MKPQEKLQSPHKISDILFLGAREFLVRNRFDI